MSDYIGQADSFRNPIRMAWMNLPVLLCGSAAVAAAWALVRAVSPSLGWLPVIAIGLLVLPVQVALVAGCLALIDGERFTIASFLTGLPRTFGRSIMIIAVPLLTVMLVVLASYAWQQTGHLLFLGSLSVAGAVSAAGIVLLLVALPYQLRTSAGWRRTWLVSAYLVSRNPIPVLATISAIGLAVWTSAYLSFAALLVLPAPVALIWAGAVDISIKRARTAQKGFLPS